MIGVLIWLIIFGFVGMVVCRVCRDIAKSKNYRQWGSHEYHRDEEEHHRD